MICCWVKQARFAFWKFCVIWARCFVCVQTRDLEGRGKGKLDFPPKKCFTFIIKITLEYFNLWNVPSGKSVGISSEQFKSLNYQENLDDAGFAQYSSDSGVSRTFLCQLHPTSWWSGQVGKLSPGFWFSRLFLLYMWLSPSDSYKAVHVPIIWGLSPMQIFFTLYCDCVFRHRATQNVVCWISNTKKLGFAFCMSLGFFKFHFYYESIHLQQLDIFFKTGPSAPSLRSPGLLEGRDVLTAAGSLRLVYE